MLGAGEVMAAYRFSGYWRDVGTIESLWDANMDLISDEGGVQLYDAEWPIYARSPTRPPHFTGEHAVVSHSLATGGCVIQGTVENSVLFRSVTVEEGATVRYSILMPGTVVKAGATVDYAIVAGERCDRCRRYGRRAAGGRRGRLGHHGGRQRNQGGRPGHGPCPRHGHPQRQGC